MLALPEINQRTAADGLVTFERVPAAAANGLRQAWLDLANDAAEPNYYYAPDFLLAAFRHLRDRGSSALLLAWQGEGRDRRLIGLLPIMRSRLYWGLPMPLLHTWHNPYCSCSAPLLRRGCEAAAAEALLNGVATFYGRGPAIYLHRIDPDGPAFRAIRGALEARGQAWREVRTLGRAVATPAADVEAFASKNWSSKRRKGMRRKSERLSELGEVRYELAETPDDVSRALEDFMALEKASWKGDAGSAMASKASTAEFMRQAYQGGSGQTRAAVQSLSLNGRKIAIGVLAKSGSRMWAPKIASDATYNTFAPGVLLAMNSATGAAGRLAVDCVDSASRPGSWIEPYWVERQQLADVIVATSPAMPSHVIGGCVRLDRLRRGLGPRLRKAMRRTR